MQFEDGRYRFSGVDLLSVADEFDSPLYVYDANTMIRQYKRLQDAFGDVKLKIKYACKALSNQAVLKLFRSLGSGLDAVSIQEVWLGLHAGYEPSEILFTPNGVSFDEIKLGVEAGVVINIDNIAILEHFGHEYGNKVPCCIRLNPHIVAGGNQHIQTGHIDSKFGISVHQLRHVERIVKTYDIRVNGLHVHTGSEILDAGVFLRAAELMFESARHFEHLQFIDFGSGFKVAYKDDDVTTDIEELGQKLGKRFREFCDQYGSELELWFEPGKFLVSESGVLLVKVNTVKQTMATVFAGVDSGQNHLIRPMFYDAYHHIVNISNPTGKPRVYTVVGYICETDTFAWDRKINEIREGDILAIMNAGAYGFTMSNNYNSRFRPAEVLVYNGKAQLIRRRETLEDLLNTQVDVQIGNLQTEKVSQNF
ncbi:MAG: diaminopimelate decarboxylase [Bacteroidetes bacterium]|nr:MAG: diaminopimelate decarboxylase [Bacteroidota bacterium]REK05316.1 MAG: diaminopimelate decarboxylase [Bacteroidota bacterium]REK36384.1 MAG: diaminopimelate decarboxylase [Bacteroidota bacterium]REK51522.1 MAG: diaminopimelate decarboxylase [Bacteroidota bacterium]